MYEVQQRTAGRWPGNGLMYLTTHAAAPSAFARSGALLAAQASFITLPDELLRTILPRAWADRPRRQAAEEVRAVAGLACVCRRVCNLLREIPLPLALNFSAAPLSDTQRHWLLDPARAGRVEAASFHPEDALWEQPLLDGFLARHGGALLQLSGVPLRLLARAQWWTGTHDDEDFVPDLSGLDLSILRLTKLGIDCGVDQFIALRSPGPCSYWLWPERLPGTLEELHLLGLDRGEWMESMMWGWHLPDGLARPLPPLQTLRMTASKVARSLDSFGLIALLQGIHSLPALQVHGSGADVDVYNDFFDRVRSMRVAAGGRVRPCNFEEYDMTTYIDSLCPAGLQAVELCSGRYIELEHHLPDNATLVDVVRELISRRGDQFATEVGIHGTPGEGPGHMHCLNRLAWRRWPAPDAPDLPAARAAHERARAWAAAGGQ